MYTKLGIISGKFDQVYIKLGIISGKFDQMYIKLGIISVFQESLIRFT